MSFASRLTDVIAARGRLCMGLDPDLSRLPAELQALPPAEAILRFNTAIIAATAGFASAFKLNFAFYEQHGSAGLDALQATIRAIPSDCLIVADNKRGDIANSATAYATSAFDYFGCDAVTVSPYMGGDSLEPFLAYGAQEKGSFILCRTSNPGGNDLQNLVVDGGLPLYLKVVQLTQQWDAGRGAAGLVVGATYPAQLAAVRELAPDTPILIPGVGTQGGDIRATLKANANGPALVNIARAIIYAGEGGSLAAMAEAAAQAAAQFQQAVA